jgi:hypothetical protein
MEIRRYEVAYINELAFSGENQKQYETVTKTDK